MALAEHKTWDRHPLSSSFHWLQLKVDIKAETLNKQDLDGKSAEGLNGSLEICTHSLSAYRNPEEASRSRVSSPALLRTPPKPSQFAAREPTGGPVLWGAWGGANWAGGAGQEPLQHEPRG